jgi:hypothetical protein
VAPDVNTPEQNSWVAEIKSGKFRISAERGREQLVGVSKQSYKTVYNIFEWTNTEK